MAGPTKAELAAELASVKAERQHLQSRLEAAEGKAVQALEQQTATSDILRVISRSHTDVQPVFDAIVASAVRLLGGYSALLTRVSEHQLELASFTSTSDEGNVAARAAYPQPLPSYTPQGQAIRARAPFNVADAQTDPRLPKGVHRYMRARGGLRSVIAVPLLRQEEAIGAMAVSRREAGGFTADEISLLQTFAEQAVIAIENVRLFTELQASNRELTDSLTQQTATAEILRVISSSPIDIQPVLDAVSESAARLCDAYDAAIYRVEGDRLLLVAHHGSVFAGRIGEMSLPLIRGTANGLAVLDAAPLHIADIQAERDRFPEGSENARQRGYRTVLITPLMREGVAIGTISVRRAEVHLFTDRQISLLQTFADQAVIAIENVRLFTELQTSNRELRTALDTQTATSDILRVISRTQTDVQPVFAAILECALRLCEADTGGISRVERGEIDLVEFIPNTPENWAVLREHYPRPADVTSLTGRAIVEARIVHVPDVDDPTAPDGLTAVARTVGFRSHLSVPILRDNEPIGVLSLQRRLPGPFSEAQIEVVRTFADQAVIAIENARLLTELQSRTQQLTRSVEKLTALGEVVQAVSSSLELETVLATIVSRAVHLAGAHSGTIWEYDDVAEEFRLRITPDVQDRVLLERREATVKKGEGAVGRVAVTLEPVQILDISTAGAYEGQLRDALVSAGTRALLAVPLLRDGRVLGGLVVSRRTPGEFPPEVVDLLKTFATQSALAIQNARLFREIEIKSRELEVASQHKSEFLASMSHELRTPLNAIIGFSDVLLQGMFGETNEKQTEYLNDILASGQHLLSLINDILDLSKIEAGRMDLDVSTFDLPTAIDDAMLLMRERASRRAITLERQVGPDVGEISADQRKVKQVLLNLLSNAVKFTPQDGRITVGARLTNGFAEISVSDTGIGIAPEDQEAVFEEFRQVGKADKKAEGTGLGLALCRKFVDLHGGRISVSSEVGKGSTFTFTIPVRL